ncbi:MAG TPA: DUF6263 family protein [Chitinophagaceae bacterium]|nr:DUF6263 family protein [Chitinophagaceae bacterium]
MKNIKLILFVFCAFALITGFQSCQSTKSSTAAKFLKFNFEKGKGYDYEMVTSMDQEIMGQDIQMDMSFYYSMDVSDDDGKSKTINTSIDRFKMKAGAMGFTIDIDTDKPLPDLGINEEDKDPMKILNALFGAIKDQKFSMKVDAEGKVIEITGFENMAKNIVDSLDIKEEEKEKMMQQFNKQFNAEQMKSQFERTWYIFPNKEVKVGDTWEKNTSLGSDEMGGGNYKSTYKVTDIEGNMVTLEESTEISSEKGEMKMKGEITGTIVVDSDSGLIVKADQDMTLKPTEKGKGFEIKAKTKIRGKAR